MIRKLAWLGLWLAGLAAVDSPVWADAKSRMAAETVEDVMQRFGRKAVQESTEAFARKIEAMAARHGEAGAAWVAARPLALKLVAQHGDDAAAALVKHSGGIAEPVLETFGTPAVRALGAVGPQNGRRLAMLAEGGELAAIGHTPELLAVIAKHGDVAADWVWRNKGALAVGATLTAFLANPRPFLDGAKSVTETVAVHALAPALEQGTVEMAQQTNWTLVFSATLALVGGVVAIRRFHRK